MDVGDYKSEKFADVDFLFLVEGLDARILHFFILFLDFFGVAFDLVDRGFEEFEDPGSDSVHEFKDGFVIDCGIDVRIFAYDFFFLFGEFAVLLLDSGKEVPVLGELIVDEDRVLDVPLLYGHRPVVVQ